MTEKASWLARNLGLYQKSEAQAAAFFARDISEFDRCKELIENFDNPSLRTKVILCSVAAGSWEGREVIALPVNTKLAFKAFLSKLKIRAMVPLSPLPEKLATAASRLAVRIANEDVSADTLHWLVGKDRTWDERKNKRVGKFFADAIYRKLQTNGGKAGGITRLSSLDHLKQKLRNPKTVLCLGNGPSSEDEKTVSTSYDVLFRVNHSWLKRGILSEPDLVFTGLQGCMRKLRKPVFCMFGGTMEKILLMVRAKNVLAGRRDYIMVGDKNSAFDFDINQRFRPTNGAIMVAVAVALQPEHLVIAGIDMFQHPEGSYPGDKNTANAYSASHSHDSEVEFIMRHLSKYEGRLTIISDALRNEWETYKNLQKA